MEASEVLNALHQHDSPDPSVFMVRRYTNTPFIPWVTSRLLYLNVSDLPRGTSFAQFPLNHLHLWKLLPYSKTEVLLSHEEGETGYRTYPLSQGVLWKCSKEPCHLSNPVSLSMPSPAPPPHLEEGIQMEGKLGYNPALQCLQDFDKARAQLESKQSEEAQKLDCKYNARQIKMERRHEQEWARMAQEGDHTFQEVFSMTSLAKSVKLLPWCISTSIPLCHMDDALVAAKQQGKTAPTTVGATKLEEPSAPGLSSSPATSLESLPPAIPLLLDLLFEDISSMGCPFFEFIAGPSQKKGVHSPSRPFGAHHGKRTQIDSPEVEVRIEHSSTWGDDYISKLIPETRPSSGQQRQEIL